jgi:F0F1-type ATP synthase assembly protein I
VDLRDRRELNNGAGDALARAVELVVTPLIFGFFGYLLDGWIGTRPVLMFVLFGFVLAYVVWKNVTLYGRAMEKEHHKLFGHRGDVTS